MKKLTKCVQCGGVRFRLGKTVEVWKVGRTLYRVRVPTQTCSSCGEEYVDGPAFHDAERRVAAAIARSGRVSAETFELMRSVMGIRAKDLAALLDVDPVTISRWENGRREMDPHAWALLAGMVLDEIGEPSTTKALLESIRHPPKIDRTVEVRLG